MMTCKDCIHFELDKMEYIEHKKRGNQLISAKIPRCNYELIGGQLLESLKPCGAFKKCKKKE